MPLSPETEARLTEAKEAGTLLEDALRAEVERLTFERDQAVTQAQTELQALKESIQALVS